MSHHDELTKIAKQQGHDSKRLRAAADSNAGNFWFYSLIAAAVWYFFGWKWALIPLALAVWKAFNSISASIVANRLEIQEQEAPTGVGGAPMSAAQAEAIMQDYGNVLQNDPVAPMCVRDAKKLPYPKKQIKDALIFALAANADPRMKEVLKQGLLQLASYQNGVGDKDQGFDVGAFHTDDPVAIAESLAEDDGDWRLLAKIVEDEQASLRRELQELGLW